MANFEFSRWPPALSDSQLDTLTLYAKTFALSHGLVYLPTSTPQPLTPTSAIHAPFSLFPSPFPRRLFHLAQRLQRSYNVLYSRIAMDEEFLDHVMGEVEGVGKVDEFVGELWRGWKHLRQEGLAQPLQLGLFRSDYLLHAPTKVDEEMSLKQVEFNTISSSFGALSDRAAALHRYLHASTQYYNCTSCLKDVAFPPNNTTSGLVEGLVEAHKAYKVPGARILFVVQAGERNVFDQRWLEYELLERHSIHVVRQTFDDLAHSATVEPTTLALLIKQPGHVSRPSVEISTVYIRAGYTPTDYPTPSHYLTRILLERSRAIKCPSIALQLAGGKKVQEVLTEPGVLEKFLCDETRYGNAVFGKTDLDEIRASWMGMWGLDYADKENPEAGVQKARNVAASLVLKPQREGGGNNVYKEAIPPFLDSLPPQERQAWIAMELIVPPSGASNYLVRSGGGTEAPVRTEVVSELGIFGWSLFGGEDGEVKEKEVGWLVRTKGEESNEGGVAAGFSVLDSIILIDD